jgi:hypothetical protein
MKRYVARCTPWGTVQTGDYFRQLTQVEKAAVLAHETAHLLNHDALRRLWWVLSLQVLFRPQWVFARCREQEFAADRYVRQMGLARGMRSFLCRYPQPASALHPSTKERLEALNG